MNQSELLEKIKEFDPGGVLKSEIEDAIIKLGDFRGEYPFKEVPELIDELSPDDIFDVENSRVGPFFLWIEFRLKPLGHLFVYSTVYRNIRDQLDNFKTLLKNVVDDDLTLAQKVDLSWDRIKGLGGDKHVAKKIIYCFNDEYLPIFKTTHLEYFYKKLENQVEMPLKYENMSLGEKYQILVESLLAIKEKQPKMRKWENPYFSRFLYEMYTPPSYAQISEEDFIPKPLNALGLLFEPKSHDEVIFLFSKLHIELNFPYITKIQRDYPDIFVLDDNREIKKIEIETYASQFNHDPNGCDYIVCWENDLDEVMDDWPEIIQLKDFI